MLISTLLVAFATADSGIQPMGRLTTFAGSQLVRRQGSCAQIGGR
jgi:hypothetical protein